MTLRTLLEDGTLALALLPASNDHILTVSGRARAQAIVASSQVEAYHASSAKERLALLDLDSLDTLVGYTVPLIAHDYGAKTPLMWNALYEKLGLRVRNIMVVGDPKDAGRILRDLAADPKYLGGGAGVGFKEAVLAHLTPEPSDLQSVNIILNRAGVLYGANTDALGLARSLDDALATVSKGIPGAHVVLYGAGGVAKEFARILGREGAASLAIVNRTASKAVALAHELTREFPRMESYAVPERLSRGVLLNSDVHPDAIVNTTDKGSDGPLKRFAFYVAARDSNEGESRTLLRYLRELSPEVVIVDIVLPKGGPSISLRLARAEGLSHLVDGVPMVVNQAAPAYRLIQELHPDKHAVHVSEEDALAAFRDVTRG